MKASFVSEQVLSLFVAFCLSRNPYYFIVVVVIHDRGGNVARNVAKQECLMFSP